MPIFRSTRVALDKTNVLVLSSGDGWDDSVDDIVSLLCINHVLDFGDPPKVLDGDLFHREVFSK